MPPSRKQQVVDLLKSLETKNPVPFAYVNPNKYIQHNLQLGPDPEGVCVNRCRCIRLRRGFGYRLDGRC